PNGKMLGALVVGFPLTNLEDTGVDRAGAIQSGIWLDQRLYIEAVSLADRQLVSERLRAASSKETANHFPIDLESGPHLLYYKALDPETQFAPAYQVCLYPLSASIRDEQALRWKIIAFGLVVLSFGFAASLFVAQGLSKSVETDEEFPLVDLAKIVQQAVSLTEPKWRRQTQATGLTVEVVAEAKASPFVAGQESALREVLTNLIFNAVDAMPQGGRISLETTVE